MSTIYLDPVAMDVTAGAIGEHAREVEATIADLESACAAEVPPSLVGWLADELHDITVHARLAELLYVVAALDTALRAQQIQADQSLAVAWPDLTTPTDLGTMGDLGAALAGSTVVGGTSTTFAVSLATPTSMTIGGDSSLTFPVSVPTTMAIGGTGPYSSSDPSSSVTMVIPPIDLDAFSGLSPSGLAAVMGVFDTIHDSAATWMAPNGLTARGGQLVDSAGHVGTYSNVHPDPYVRGRFEVRP